MLILNNKSEEKELLFPNYEKGNLYNLSASIAEDLGVHRDNMIPDKSINLDKGKVLLILVDGFGYNIMKAAGIPTDNVKKFSTIFPSTTSTALTSLNTISTPAEHGILGYTTYTKEYGVIQTLTYTLPEVSEPNIIKKISGLDMSTRFNVKSIGRELRDNGKKTEAVVPESISGSSLTKMLYGISKPAEFKTFWDSVYLTKGALSRECTFVSLYLPFVDSLAHKYGPFAEPTLEAARYIYNTLVNTFSKYLNKYDIIITADHGFVEVSKTVFLDQHKDLLNMLESPPYGDARAVFMKSHQDLKKNLNDKFENFRIFDQDEIINNGLLGLKGEKPTENSSEFIGVPLDNGVYVYRYKGNYSGHKGHHGALLKEEMEIPVINLK